MNESDASTSIKTFDSIEQAEQSAMDRSIDHGAIVYVMREEKGFSTLAGPESVEEYETFSIDEQRIVSTALAGELVYN